MDNRQAVQFGCSGRTSKRPPICKRLAGAFCLLTALCTVGLTPRPAVPDDAKPAVGNASQPVYFLIDRSGSMAEHGKMQHTAEAAKLGAIILSRELKIVAFADAPEQSPVFDLDTQRPEAMKWLGQLEADGETQYGQALGAISPDAMGALILSDGVPSDPPDEILALMREHVKCPLHAIAMETSPEAEHLLARMAAATGGGFYRVQRAPEVVEAFLKILGAIRQFRRCDLKDGSLTLTAQGELLAIGYGVEPNIATNEPIERHETTLPGGKIHVARVILPRQKSVVIAAEPPPVPQPIRLTVLRFDLPTAATEFRRLGTVDGKATVRARTRFLDAGGRPVDPRGPSTLSASYEVEDEEGKVQQIEAKPSPTQPVMEATFALPPNANGQPVVIRSHTVDRSAGVPFTSLEAHAVEPATLPAAPLVEAASTLRATCGRPGDPLRCVAEIVAKGEAAEIAAFLRDLADKPPVFAVETPSGKTFDSLSQPEAFVVQTRTASGRTVVDVAVQGIEEPGQYSVVMREATAAGHPYPQAAVEAQCVGSELLQLVIVAHRRNGRIVLFDSEQPREGQALAGDRLACEVVCGTMDPKVFLSLGNGLQARFIGADGAIQNVELALQGDRYVTEPVPLEKPGVLRVVVDIAVEGLRLTFEGQLDIAGVDLEMVLSEKSLLDRPGRIPSGALLPFEIDLRGRIGAQTATADQMAETIHREGIQLRWVLADGAGKETVGESHQPGENPWASRIWIRGMGRQVLTFELVDAKQRVRQGLRWEFEVVESPVHFAVMAQGHDGKLAPAAAGSAMARWLPAFCVTSPECVITATPTRSPFFGSYYLAGAAVDDVEARFDKEGGQFVAAVATPGTVACKARLQRYRFGASSHVDAPEIQLLEEVPVAVPLQIRWGRTAAAGTAALGAVVGLMAAGYLALRAWYLNRMRRPQRRISLMGESYHNVPVVAPEQPGWRWPSCEVWVCGGKDNPENVFPVYPCDGRNGHEILARVRQHLDGTPTFHAEADLPDLRRHESRRLELGDETVRISDTTTLTLDPPDPEAIA